MIYITLAGTYTNETLISLVLSLLCHQQQLQLSDNEDSLPYCATVSSEQQSTCSECTTDPNWLIPPHCPMFHTTNLFFNCQITSDTCLSMYPFIHCLSIHLTIMHPFINPSIHLLTHPSIVPLSIYLSHAVFCSTRIALYVIDQRTNVTLSASIVVKTLLQESSKLAFLLAGIPFITATYNKGI